MARRLSGKTVAVALLAAVGGLAATVFVVGLTGGSQHVPRSAPGVAFTVESPHDAGPAFAVASAAPRPPAGPLDRTVHDRATRDALRRRILAAWSEGEGDTATAARAGRFVPMPERDGGGVDPAYLQSVIRGEYLPMAKSCYEELLARKKDAAGRIIAEFEIVGDEKIGGIVEEVQIETEGGLGDEKLVTCLRESLLAVAFRPPPRSGVVTVGYPISMTPDEPGD